MAGNTKLVEFSPRRKGKPGIIHLARWDGKATVTISELSLENLRAACYRDLPQQPQQRKDDLDGFLVRYDEEVGRIRVDMDVDTAELLVDKLKFFRRDEETVEQLRPWIHGIDEAIQAHRDYRNREGEPGINEDPS